MSERDLFIAALQIPEPAERSAWLDRECSGDVALRQRIDVLLQAFDKAGSLLENPAVAVGVTSDEPITEAPGAVIGPYKLIEPIGEGGMGTVWMAQQTDPVKRLVAVKLIKAGMDSRQVIARFGAERQALALMDHPHIAKVLDAGATEAGRPYFVMDLVKGVPITSYCDEHHLTPRQRLELFIPVCQAVQHAHQKGIIHRDLKPSNVLVALYDGKPVPKVIDFGVAKAAGQSLTEQTLVTGLGHIVGTLEYMSPEQAEINQLDIDTRSDIYSLGVLLYELLAGSPPFSRKELEQAGLLEMLRVIREQEPTKPSTKLSTAEGLPTLAANRGMEPARLTRLVRGELDWIVMKALEKDRNRRYETANAFAMDVQRYLADEPVLACPPSAGYRLRKFARRNKGGLAVTALVLFFLVLFGSGIGWAVRDRAAQRALYESERLAQQAEAERATADRKQRLATQVELILNDVDRLQREQKWAEALIAARRAEAALAGGEADPTTERRVRELLKDLEFIDRLEQVRMQRATLVDGEFDYAGPDRDYAKAFRDYGVDVGVWTVEASVDRLKARPALVIPLAAALDDWMGARAAVSKGNSSGWKRLLAVARGIDPEPLRGQIHSTWERPVSEVRDELRRLAESIDIRAHHPATLLFLSRSLERVGHPDSAVRILRDAQYIWPGDFWLNYELCSLLRQQKDLDGALRYGTAAVALRPNSAAAHNSLGVELRDLKKLPEAIACFRKAIELDPKHAKAHGGLGDVLYAQRKLDDAITAFRKATELDPKFVGAYVCLAEALRDQKKMDEALAAFRKASEIEPRDANAHIFRGVALHAQGRLDEAIAAYRKAIELDPKFANTNTNLGISLTDEGKLDEALASFRKAAELDPKDPRPYFGSGNVLRDQRKLDESVAAFRKAIELDPTDAKIYTNLGNVLYSQKKLDEAIAAHRRAIELDPKHAKAYTNLGNALFAQKKVDEALAAYHRAIELDPTDPKAHYNLGLALSGGMKLDEAIAAYRKAIELDPRYVHAHNNLGLALGDQKKWDDAVAAYRKAIELDPRHANAYNNLGVALGEQKKLGEAIAAFRKAIELDPKFAFAHKNLGYALFLQNKLDEAMAAYRTAIELDPKYVDAYHDLSTALRVQKKWDESIAALRKAVEIDPNHAHVRDHLASSLSDRAWVLITQSNPARRDPGRALVLAKEAVEIAASLSMAWQCLGWIHYRRGDWRSSIEALEKSCELQDGGTGDAGQWIVLALAHARLAHEGSPEKEREFHKAEARRRYNEADAQIDSWWRDRPGDDVGQAVWDFRAEARALMGVKGKKE